MKRVLIITYYWPPSGGAGVQRWLKFVKYLNDFGWEPVVYTPLNPEIPYHDETLLSDIPKGTEVIGTKIFEPYMLYNLLTGKQKNTKFQHGFLQNETTKSPSTLEKMAIWIRGNLFIPDARVFWIQPSVHYLIKYLQERPVDLIVSSGPPHSMHLIASKLKKKTNLPWIADFRDPWTGIYYFEKLMPSKWAKRRHQSLEQSCLDEANHIVTVGPTMKNDFEKRTKTPISVITNGFDSSDYSSKNDTQPKKFSIFYSGMFLPDQNPPELWEALQELVDENPAFEQAFQLHFTGRCDASILSDIEKNGLSRYLKIQDYVPHAELPALQQSSALLLLSINRIENASYILTGKFFEYLAAARPILALCPEQSDVARIILETQAGYVIDFNQKERLKELISSLFQQFQQQRLQLKNINVSAYSRIELTKKMAALFDQQIKK
jgi:glycosyltransferase involved in cell wall biosynthesis